MPAAPQSTRALNNAMVWYGLGAGWKNACEPATLSDALVMAAFAKGKSIAAMNGSWVSPDAKVPANDGSVAMQNTADSSDGVVGAEDEVSVPMFNRATTPGTVRDALVGKAVAVAKLNLAAGYKGRQLLRVAPQAEPVG